MKKGILLFLSALLCFGFAALCGPAGGGVCSRVKLSGRRSRIHKAVQQLQKQLPQIRKRRNRLQTMQKRAGKSKADHKRTGICGNLI